MQIEHKKNTAYYLTAPIVDKTDPSIFLTGDTPAVTGYSKDGAGAWTNFTPGDVLTEIGTTGIYEMDLSAAEMNHDQVLIKITSTNGGDTAFLFDMRGSVDAAESTLINGAHGGAAATLTLSDYSNFRSTGFSTFDPTTDKVTLDNTAHGGAAASLTVQKISVDATGSGTDAVNILGDTNFNALHVQAVGIGEGFRIDAESGVAFKPTSTANTSIQAIGSTAAGSYAVEFSNFGSGKGMAITGLEGGLVVSDILSGGDITTTGDLVISNYNDFKATGFSTFNPSVDKVTLDNTAHGGAAATFTLTSASYDNFKADVSGLSTFDPTTEKVTLADGVTHGGAAAEFQLNGLTIQQQTLNKSAVIIAGNGTGSSIEATNDIDVTGDLNVVNFADFKATIPAVQDANLIQINGTTAEVANLAEFFANTVAEITGIPGVTDKMIEKLKWICHLALYQRETTDSSDQVKQSNGTTNLAAAGVSDNGTTFTRTAYADN